MGLAALGFCSREGKSTIHPSVVVTGRDKHPEAAVSGATVLRWHSLVRAAAPFCLGQRPFLHSSPHSHRSCPGSVTWCISSAIGRMLSSVIPIPAKLHCLIKSTVITDISCRGLRLPSPSSVFYPISLLLRFLCTSSLSSSGLLLLALSRRAR